MFYQPKNSLTKNRDVICLPVRRAVVLIQVAPLRVAKDYGTSSLKH